MRAKPPRAGAIVVGVDGSTAGTLALRWAVDEARRRRCGVRAIMVWQPEPALPADESELGGPRRPPDDSHDRCALVLEQTVRSVVGPRGERALKSELVSGWAPEVLVDAAEDADLLVVGSHGHARWYRSVLGTVASYCVHHARCPVVVIPPRVVESTDSGLARERGPEQPGDRQPLGFEPGPLL